MKNKPVTWSYRKGSSPLHRLPAGLKLASLLFFSLLAFIPGPEFRSLFILSGIAFILILLSFVAGIGPRQLLRGSGPLFLVIIAVFIFQSLEFAPLGFRLDGFWEAAIFCARIGAAFAAGTLLFSVTTPGEIRKSLAGLEVFLHLTKPGLSLHISLMLGFLPRFFEIWEDLNLAWESRGGKKNLSRIVILVPLLVERMMIKAAETAAAMEARAAQ